MEKIPIDEIKKELRSAELSDEAIEELLQVLSIKSLTKLEEEIGLVRDDGESNRSNKVGSEFIINYSNEFMTREIFKRLKNVDADETNPMPIASRKEICIGFVNNNHFVQVFLNSYSKMPRQKGPNDEPPSDDIGWKFGTQVEGTRHHIICKFCGHHIKGGITRFKQHLAHQTGQVRSCPNVSRDVMQEMMKHLQNKKMSKVDKQKRKAELEAHIRGDDLYDENEERDFVDLRDDDSDSDPEMTRARQASHGSQYDAGGSSGAGGSAQRMPKGGRNWIKPNAPEARLRAMDVELQKSKSTKQRKISTMNLQKLKERLGRAVSKFILYNRIPFNAVDSEYTQPMLDVAAEVGPGVKGPSAYEVSEVYLGMEHDEMTEWIGSFKGIWAERGVSIMCDGWSSLTRQHIINFLVYCNTDKVVDEIGEQYVVQVVTDNEPALKAAANKKSVAKVIEDAMFNSDEWKNSRWGKAKTGQPYNVKKNILGKEFWQKATELCKVHEPLVRVLRLVDGDEKPTMGFIYEAIDRAKLAIKRDCRYYTEYWKIIDTRWSFQLHQDLHAAATNQETFGTPLAQRAWKQSNPAEWWIIHGSCAPELQKIAVKVLSQTTTLSHCERNWSTFSLIHTKTRNRLKYKKIQRLVFITYNMRLKLRHVKRSSQEEIDRSFNPINLDYIFEEDDPISPWIEERENPLLDGVDNSEWLDLVSDDDGGGGNDSNGDGGDGSDGNDGGGTHRYQPRRTSQSSTPTPTQSDNSGGLTPSDGGGDDGDGEGTSHGDGGGGGGDNGGDGGDSTSFGVGSEDFIEGFGLCDVGEHYDIGEPVAPLPQLPRRFRGSDTRRDERRIRSREQQLDSSDSSHSYPYHPYPSYSSDSQSYPYPPQQNYPWPPQQRGPPGYGLPNYQQAQQEYVDPFQPSIFTYIFPTGWGEGSSNQAQQSDSQDAPRHSFWWGEVVSCADETNSKAEGSRRVEVSIFKDGRPRGLSFTSGSIKNVLLEKLGAAGEAVADLKRLFSLAEKFGYSEWIQFDASVVRGLAYYTGTVFEKGFDREGKLRAICGGGRYDRLLSTFGGDDIPACGFGFGDAVIIELLEEKGLIPEIGEQVENIVCHLDPDLQDASAAVATILREKGQSVDLVLENKPLKWVFKRAARINARRLVLVGSSEWQKGMVSVKILSSGEQYEIEVDKLE
ncbi:unnamed protein product [Camellia sinensis]